MPYLGIVCVIPLAVSAILRLEVTFRKRSRQRGFVKAGGHSLSLGELGNQYDDVLSPGVIKRYLIARFPAPAFAWPDDWDNFLRRKPEAAPEVLEGCYLFEIYRLDTATCRYKGRWLPSAGLVVAPVNAEKTMFVRKGVFTMPGIPKGGPESYPWRVDKSMEQQDAHATRPGRSPFNTCKMAEIDLI
jgi:hypothetical protein